jgi:hypothetical protein
MEVWFGLAGLLGAAYGFDHAPCGHAKKLAIQSDGEMANRRWVLAISNKILV